MDSLIKILYRTFLILFFFSVMINGQDSAEKNSAVVDQNGPFNIIPDITDIYGVTWRDLDNDGKPDLYLTSFRGINRCLINRGKNNPFADATIRSGLGGNLMPSGIRNLELGNAVFDWDNDGDQDVLIVGWGDATRFYSNEGELDFIPISEVLNIKAPYDFNDAVVADVNNDGYLDLFLTDEHFQNRLLINESGIRFRDVSNSSGLDDTALSQGAVFADIDSDGDPDLYVSNWFAPDWFYENDGTGVFKRRQLDLSTLIDSVSTNSPSFADIDNDGDLDLFVASKDGRNFLYINQKSDKGIDWLFSDSSSVLSMPTQYNSYGGIFADFDNDGWQDLYVSNRGPNRFFLNVNGRFYFAREEKKVPGNKVYSTGSAVADIDSDGKLDLFISNKDTFCLLLEKPGELGDFLRFDIRGTSSNFDAIGSKIWLYEFVNGDTVLAGFREIADEGGYLSQSELIAHFGIRRQGPFFAKILFPGGIVIEKNGLIPGQTYIINEIDSPMRQILSFNRWAWLTLHRTKFWLGFLIFAVLMMTISGIMRLGVKRYQWSAGSASWLFLFFFAVTILFLIVLRKYSLFYLFISLGLFVALFAGVSLFIGEKILRLKSGRNRLQQLLIFLSKKIHDLNDKDEVLALVRDQLLDKGGYDYCEFIHFDNQNENFHFPQMPEFEKYLKENQNRIRELMTLRDSFRLRDLPSPSVAPGACRYWLIVPAKHMDHLYGAMALGTDKKEILPQGAEFDVYTTLANQIAVSFLHLDQQSKTADMVRKLTAAEVRQAYLNDLESKNLLLKESNDKLSVLYRDLKSTQSQLVLSEKMASLGRLVAGIAHELNNPIGFIYANVKQLRGYTSQINAAINQLKEKEEISDPEMEKLLTDIDELISDTIIGTNTVKELVTNLKKFSHLDRGDYSIADIHKGIDISLMILRPLLKQRIVIEKKYGTIPEIECQPGQMNQVFLNVLTNAVQSIEDEGQISISTAVEKGSLIISIEDNGRGIAKEDLDNIFEPFYTTKEAGTGTGLGLSISRSIVEEHGGDISIKSKTDSGTTVTIRLPITMRSKS